MNAYVVHAILPPIIPGQTNEVSVECADMEEVCRRIKELDSAGNLPMWQAISVFRIEDWPKVVEGTMSL
jgi:hypothetical protein